MADASGRRPAPSASGTLAATPLVNLLVYARNKRLSGTFELRSTESRSGEIAFWRGRIRRARAAPPVSYFGALCYELGWIDARTLDATLLEVATKKRLHGELLVERGAITAAQRDDALAEQATRTVQHLCGYPAETAYAFYEERASTEEPPFALDPLAPVWRALRDATPERAVRDVLAHVGGAALSMVNEAPLDRIGLTADELALCRQLASRPMTIGQLRAASSVAASRVELIAYVLVIAKCVELVAPRTSSSGGVPAAPASRPAIPAAPASRPAIPAAPPSRPSVPVAPASRPSIPVAGASRPPTITSPPSRPSMPALRTPLDARSVSTDALRAPPSFRAASINGLPAAAPSSRPAPAASAAEPPLGPADLGASGIAARAQIVDAEDYFTVLGVPDGASAEAVRAAYFRLAKLWHPDRLPSELAPFRAEVEKIFGHMTRAQQTLTDPDARRGWLAARRERDPARRPRADVLRDVDAALAKHDFAKAADEARKLVDAEVDDAEALAIVAFCEARGGEATEDELRAALTKLDRAVNADRTCERALFYRGSIHKRLGNGPAAFRDFARVVQLDPKNVDAEREVRLFEMRAKKGSGEHALGALISKIRGKK